MKFIADKDYGYIPVLKQGPNGYTEPCPFCFTKHIHGYGTGHRTPHCANIENLVSSIVLVNGYVVKQKNGYIIKHVKTNQ